VTSLTPLSDLLRDVRDTEIVSLRAENSWLKSKILALEFLQATGVKCLSASESLEFPPQKLETRLEDRG
jgi:hypothetical protein